MCDLRYSCVLFDLDGTVLDTVSDCTAAMNKTMAEFSLPLHTHDEVRSYLNDGARMLVRRALPADMQHDEAFVDKVLAVYISNYRDVCTKNSRIYDGVYNLLCSLKEHGALLGIVTNKPDVQTRIMVPHYFGNLFDYYCGNSENYPVKPDKRRVEMALEALGKPAESAVFVGDSKVDVQTARNAGIPCIGVAWGFGGRACFEGNLPDRIADTAQEIFDIAKCGF